MTTPTPATQANTDTGLAEWLAQIEKEQSE